MAHMIDPLTPKLRLYTNSIVWGSSGAGASSKGKNLVSCTRNSAGNWTLKYDRVWNSCVSFSIAEVEATITLGKYAVTAIRPAATGGAEIDVEHLNAAGAAADPVSGDELHLTVFATTGGSALKNATTFA